MGLYREVGLASATFLVIGNIIGIGIFATSGGIAKELSASPWLIGVWILGGLLALIGAICYARLGVQFPHAGGEYAFLRPTYGPLAAFLSGWSSLLIGFTAPIAASALGMAHYLAVYFPAESGENSFLVRGIAIVTLLFVTTLISIGLKAGGRLHCIVTILNLLLILGFAIAVLQRSSTNEYLGRALAGGFQDIGMPSLASAVVLVMFTYSGWNATAYIAGEIKSPKRNIPASLLLGTGSVIGIYILINLAYLSAAPLTGLQGEVAVAEVVSERVFGPMGQGIVTLLIAGSILSSLTAMSIAGPRVYYAMARDRLFPDWLSVVDTTRKIPLRAIWFQTFVAIVLVSVGSFYQILYYSGFILIFFASLTVSALFKTSNYRILPVLFIAVNALVLVNATISYPWQAFWGLVTVLAGVPVYLYYKKKLKPEVGKSPRVIYGYTFGQESSGGRQGEVQRAGFRSTGEVKDSA